MKKFIMSIDAETDGLWGNPFAIAGIIYDSETGQEIDKICFRLPNEIITSEWVIKNVLPTLNFPVTHGDNNFHDQFIELEGRLEKGYKEMLKDFSKWYLKYKNESEVLWHMGHIVESHLFRELYRLRYIEEFDAPYVPIEVSAYLEIAGESADSVDSYAKKYNLDIKDYGSTHNPLYDCEVSFKVYKHILDNK